MVPIPPRDGIKILIVENSKQALLRAIIIYFSHTIPHPINNETTRLLGSHIISYLTIHHNAERKELETKRIRFLYYPGLLYVKHDSIGIYVSKRILWIPTQGGKITKVSPRNTPPIWSECYSFNELTVYQ